MNKTEDNTPQSLPSAPGVYRGIPDAVYHAAADRLSKHALDDFAKCPYAFFRRRAEPDKAPPPEQSEAFDVGSLVHAAVLEPARFSAEFVALPEEIKVRRGKAYEAFLVENEGKTVVKREHYDLASDIRTALAACPPAARVLDTCPRREITLLWSELAAEMKARVDFMSENGAILGDLKTAQDASPEAFVKAADAFGYDIQAATYLRAARVLGMTPKLFVFVVVEKAFPFTAGIYAFDADSDFVRAGEKALIERLSAYGELKDSPKALEPFAWEAFNLSLPAWSSRGKNLSK